uniref:C2H2-type domain-containing protein n=1 Tax=Gouania willdenowi TaxID=441366 RepID=A0A8C5G998_GOUWI
MEVDDCNEQPYISANGDTSMEREFSGALGGPTMSTPNSKENSPRRSLSANSIKVELYSDEDPDRSIEDERGEQVEEEGSDHRSERGSRYRELRNPDTISAGVSTLQNGKLKCDICGMICLGPNVLMVHKRSHTGERPFQCNQCGASFTQKGNLLRHIKLHSGEKPFKCPFCNYACRRRDALSGHLRTHAVSSPTVGKPFKCNYCGRSYKQQSTLEEHRERCHSYLQSLESQQAASAQNPGLKHMRLDLADAPYAGLDKARDLNAVNLDVTHYTGLAGEYTIVERNGSGGVSDQIRPLHFLTSGPSCLSELGAIQSTTHFPTALVQRAGCTGTGPGETAVAVGGRGAAEGHEDLPPARCHLTSPSNGCQDSTDTESMLDETCNRTALTPTLLTNNSHHLLISNDHNLAHHRSRDAHSPSHTKDPERKTEDRGHSGHPPSTFIPTSSSPTAPSSTSREAFRVVDGEGRSVRSFRCEHCRVIFLDHVMFTIHMGCHGFRQPFECNICGHHSQDRYEFSSHIVRGEHMLD